MPVSSSSLMKTTPEAVSGRCRWVTIPATLTLRPLLMLLSSAARETRSRSGVAPERQAETSIVGDDFLTLRGGTAMAGDPPIRPQALCSGRWG